MSIQEVKRQQRIDVEQTKRVLDNLVENSIKYVNI